MTKHPDLFTALAAPFEPDEVKVRSQAGRQLHYITARTAMNRLDNVLGPENWWDDFSAHENSVLCRITIRLPDGATLTKQDAGGYAGMADSGDDDKSGYSDSFKRACVKFGVGRYLYRDGVADFADEPAQAPPARNHANGSNGKPAAEKPKGQAPSRQTNWDIFKCPPPGKAVYAWAKGMESHFSTTLIDAMRERGKALKIGPDFLAWDEAGVKLIYGDVVEFLKTLDNYKGEFNGKADAGVSVAKPATKANDGELKILRQLVVQAAEAIMRVQLGRQNLDREEVRECIRNLSAASKNGQGHTGEICQSLATCTDSAWLGNMHTDGLAYLKQITAPTPAKDDAGIPGPGEPDDEDIPF